MIGRSRVDAAGSGLVLALALAVSLLAGGSAPVVFAADESVLLERPPTKSVAEDTGPLDRSFEEPPPRDPAPVPRLQRALENLPAFFRDTELGVERGRFAWGHIDRARRDSVDRASGNPSATETSGAPRWPRRMGHKLVFDRSWPLVSTQRSRFWTAFAAGEGRDQSRRHPPLRRPRP